MDGSAGFFTIICIILAAAATTPTYWLANTTNGARWGTLGVGCKEKIIRSISNP